MNLDELVLKSLGKRPLLREKIKEERRRELYSSIENIENLISKKNELATKIMKSTLLNLDCSKDRVEFEKIEKQSQDYIAQIKARKGATVAYIPTTSRKNPQSKYWSGHDGKGGTINDAKKDNEELRKEQTVK